MKVYVHFNRERKQVGTRTNGAPMFTWKEQQPVVLHNVGSMRDDGAGVVTLVNAFGGAPQTFTNVARVVGEPEQEEA